MTTLDERDDENAWYELMEAQASNNDFKLDEDQVEHSLPHITLQSATNDDYFEKVHEYNCDHVQSGFASESDTVWQTLLRSVVNCKSVAKVGGMYRLSRSDESAAGHLQRWVAGYLPKSCKILMEIDMFLCSCDDSKMLFTDDLFNPSLVCFMKNAEIRLEVTIYSPHAHHEIPLLSALSCIECMQRETGLLDLVLAGLDGALYECGILKAAPPKWTPLWVEECGHYTHETVLLEQQRPDNSIDTPLLGTGYELCNLSREDATTINDNWKYKTSTSLNLVNSMIAKQLCAGVRCTADGKLVSWVLTYPDGSTGMLFTHPDHRGKGIARAVVNRALEKCAAQHALERRPCAPFLYIERSNEASKALFASLGFTKCNDVVWAGLKLNLEEIVFDKK